MTDRYLVRQYRPTYVSGYTDEVYSNVEYDNIVKIPFMENFKTKGFKEFKVEPYHGELIISAYYENGEHWVAGFALHENSDLMSNNNDLMRDNWRYANSKRFEN